jgi:hypothetical protein
MYESSHCSANSATLPVFAGTGSRFSSRKRLQASL